MFHFMDTKRKRLHAKVAELIQELNNTDEVFGDDNAPIWIMYGEHRYELAKELLRQTGISALTYPEDDINRPLLVNLGNRSIFEGDEDTTRIRKYILNRASDYPIIIFQDELYRSTNSVDPRFRAHELVYDV